MTSKVTSKDAGDATERTLLKFISRMIKIPKNKAFQKQKKFKFLNETNCRNCFSGQFLFEIKYRVRFEPRENTFVLK